MSTVGQVLVTDPLAGPSSGYALVGRSPAVEVADARFLEERPYVTDHLHLLESPESHFAFFPLPSGAWAYSHRFPHGKRRGSYNRIFVHTLVLAPHTLDALDREAGLLRSQCRFHRLDGEGPTETLKALGDALADGVDRIPGGLLPDLGVALPADPAAARRGELSRRRDYLRRQLGGDGLLRRVTAALSILEGGSRVLLPQDTESEQLLALVASILPWPDRGRLPWTSHLAPDAGARFRLANVPEPERAARRLADGASWRRLDQAEPAAAAEALAPIALADDDLLGTLDRTCRSLDAGLLDSPTLLVGEITWLRAGGPEILAGFDDWNRLAAILQSFDRRAVPRPDDDADGGGAERLPWQRPSNLLTSVAATVLRHVRGGQEPHAALTAAFDVLDRSGRTDLLRPDAVTELDRVDPGGLGENGVTVAVGLASTRELLPLEPTAALDILEPLWGILGDQRSLGDPVVETTLHDLGQRITVDLVLLLGRYGSEHVEAAVGRLARDYEHGLDDLVADLPTDNPAHLGLLRSVFDAAGGALGGRLARRHLLPLLARPDLFADLDSGWRSRILDTLGLHHPGDLAEVLARGEDHLRPTVRTLLGAWGRRRGGVQGQRDGAADLRTVARALARGSGLVDDLAEREEVVGLTALWIAAEAPAEDWLATALAEAAWLDALGSAEHRAAFVGAVGAAAPDGGASTDLEAYRDYAPAILDAVAAALERSKLGDAHRALVDRAARGLVAEPERLSGALGKLHRLGLDAYLDWGSTVEGLGAHLAASGQVRESSKLRAEWWRRLAEKHPLTVAGDRFAMLGNLAPSDAVMVVKAWLSKVAKLPDDPVADALVERLGLLSQHDAGTAAGLGDARNRREVLLERIAPADAFEDAWRRALSQYPNDMAKRTQALAPTLRKLLPVEGEQRTARLFELLLSPRVSPGIKGILESHLVPETFERSGALVLRHLPAVDALVAQTSLLFQWQVAQHVGRHWHRHHRTAKTFLLEAARLERFDLVAACLREGGGDLIRGLDTRIKEDEFLARHLRRAWHDPRYRDLHSTGLTPEQVDRWAGQGASA
ncbi:MAG: hypothetical protein AAGN66_13965 [Acidobacteriota bacterium]